MANNLRKFNTLAEYQSAELVKPAVSLIAATDEVYFDQKDAPVPPTMNGDIKCTFNIGQMSVGEPKQIIGTNDDTGTSAFTPTQMWVDGVEVTPSDYYTFSTAGEHIVEYKLADGVISGNSFIYMTDISNVEIGSGVTSFADWGVFAYCSITSITIPNSVTYIGVSTFVECGSLTSLTIPSGVTSISDTAFAGCVSLTSLTIEATTPPTLGDYPFDNTPNSLIIYVPSGSVNAYKAASGWSDYASRIQAIP